MNDVISNNSHYNLHALLLCSTLVFSEATGTAALAQTPDNAETGEEIVITGNRARGTTVIQSPAPIDVIDGSALEKLGANTSLRDALSQLLPSFNQLTVSSSSWNSVTRPAGLRGLGGSHVLVLVNGKRRHNSSLLNLATGSVDAGSNPVDLDLIPISAVARVEVLRDGAAAQYGSDAIAGVINLILKDNAEGGSLVVTAGQRYGYRGHTDGRNLQASGNIGFKIDQDGFINFSVDLKDANHARRAIPATGAFYYPLADGSPDPRENRDKTVFTGGLPDLRYATIGYNAAVPVGGSATLYSTATYTTRQAIVGQNFRRPNSTNVVLSFFPDGYAPNYTLDEQDFQILAGIRGDAGDWKWDLSSTYGENRTRNGSTNTVNASLGDASPTEFHTFTAKFAQWTNNIDVSRGFDIGLADPLRLSIGAEHRYEHFQTIAGDPLAYANGGYIYSSGPLAGRPATVGAQAAIVLTPDDQANLSRNSFAGYVDVGFNPTPHWFIAVAGRAEHYDDSAGNTVSGKFTTRYDISDSIGIRGTISNGFRAPALAQSGFAQTSNQFNIVNGVSTFVLSKSVQAESAIGAALGARPLKPEKSLNYSLGLTAGIGRRFNLTIDAYQIDLDNRIVQTGLLSGAAINAILVANGFQSGQSIRYFANAIDTRTRGVDVVANYDQPLGSIGSIRLSLGYNYNEAKITKVANSPSELTSLNLTLFDRAARGAIERSAPRTKLILGQYFRLGDLRVNLRETRFGKISFLNVNPRFDQFYGAKWIADIDVAYQVTKAINIAVGTNNLFDTYPDKNQVSDTNGFPPYPSQSPFGFYGGFYYGRVSISF